jgi:general secretion pathway protein D
MKTTPQSLRRRGSRAGCNPLGNQQKETKLAKVRLFASFVIFCFILASLSLVCASSFAQTPDNVAEREVQRRQAGITQGEAALARGQAAMKAKDYGAAHEAFRMAVMYLPDAVVSGKAHDEAVEGFCKTGVVLAEARIAEGRYADAEAILSETLSERYDPKCRQAQELYAHLRQPGYFNKTMSPTFIEKVEQVKQLLAEADGFYNSGRYDLAMKRYDQVLTLDPYNTAARKGQEKINNTKYKYGEEAYNETRSRQLWQVEKAWEQPVRRYGQTGEPVAIGALKN